MCHLCRIDMKFRYFVKNQFTLYPIKSHSKYSTSAICKMPQLPHDFWESVFGLLNSRMSITWAIARALGANALTISRLRCRFEQFCTTANLPHAQWQRMTIPAQGHYILILRLCDRLRPATATVYDLLNRRISPQTLRNRLWEAIIHTRNRHHAYSTTPVTRLGQEAHLLTLARWRNILFSDRVSRLAEKLSGSMCDAALGSRRLTSPLYAGWHTTVEAYRF